MTELFIQDELLEQQLKEVRTIIDQELRLGDRYLNGSLDYVKSTTGKMLRPALLLLGSRFGEEEEKRGILQLAAAVEVLHTATLIHDDIIDEAKLRRNKPSIQAKYSKEYALYMGDFLLSKCLVMLSDIELKKEIAIDLSTAVNKICIGEMMQHSKRYDTSITPNEYFRIVTRKTAGLFALSLATGAAFYGAGESRIKILARIGYHLGMIFQLVDDLLDFNGEDDVVGKELQSDIVRGYYSLPVIYALKKDTSGDLDLELNKEELKLEKVYRIVRNSGGLEETQKVIQQHLRKAKLYIKQLPRGSAKSALKKMLPKLVDRVF